MLKDEDRGVQMHAMLALSRVALVQKYQLFRNSSFHSRRTRRSSWMIA